MLQHCPQLSSTSRDILALLEDYVKSYQEHSASLILSLMGLL